MAYLNAGLSPEKNGLISLHETFHNFGLGDRYMDDVPYTLSYFVDGVEKTELLLLKGVVQKGFENDMMFKGMEFSQEHIDNLSKNALNVSKIKGNKFVMSQVVDNVKVTDKERAPKTYISGKSVYKKIEKKL